MTFWRAKVENRYITGWECSRKYLSLLRYVQRRVIN